jgi:hypothetical protein
MFDWNHIPGYVYFCKPNLGPIKAMEVYNNMLYAITGDYFVSISDTGEVTKICEVPENDKKSQ